MATFRSDTGTGIKSEAGASTDLISENRVQGDTVNRSQRNVAGKISWGGGSSAVDCSLERTNGTTMAFTLNTTIESVRLTSSPSSGDSSILILTNIGGTSVLKFVSVGAADSGGTGYRYLRTINGP